MTAKPPEKLSDLIELAIRDGRDLDPDIYTPRFSQWHTPSLDERTMCYVCLAGAVIAGTLGADPCRSVEGWNIGDWGSGWTDALRALDYVRGGDYAAAIRALSVSVDVAERDRIARDVCSVDMPEFGQFQTMAVFLAHLDELEVVAAQLRGLGY